MPGAASGETLLTADTNFVYGSHTLTTLSGDPPTATNGLVLIGDAFVHGGVFTPVSSGVFWQFYATNEVAGSAYVILASTNLVSWQPLATNTVVDGYVFSFDPGAHSFSSRFYRIAPQ